MSSFRLTPKSHTTSGFTLVEVVLYVFILSLVAVASVTALVTYSDVIVRMQLQSALTDGAQTTLERLSREIRSAESVDVLASTLTSSSSELVLDTDGDTITFTHGIGTVSVQIGSNEPTRLLSNDVWVDEFWAYHYDGAETEMVRIELALTATSSQQTLSENFSISTVIRGSYD